MSRTWCGPRCKGLNNHDRAEYEENQPTATPASGVWSRGNNLQARDVVRCVQTSPSRGGLVVSYSERDYKIGETVYRAKWDKVETGVVRSKRRVSISNSGSSYEDCNGKYVEFVAQFNEYDWIGQTYAWKFFRDPKDAYTVLARELKERMKNMNGRFWSGANVWESQNRSPYENTSRKNNPRKLSRLDGTT